MVKDEQSKEKVIIQKKISKGSRFINLIIGGLYFAMAIGLLNIDLLDRFERYSITDRDKDLFYAIAPIFFIIAFSILGIGHLLFKKWARIVTSIFLSVMFLFWSTVFICQLID